MKPSLVSTKVQCRYGAPAFLLLLAGCGDPLKQAQRLEEPRLLGVRVSGNGDAAALQPGEPATFEVLLAGKEGTLEARMDYQLCEAADSNRGVPFCANRAFANGTAPLDGAPIGFEVPASVGADRRLALLGVACVESEPSLGDKPLDWACSGSDQALRLTFDARTAEEGVISRNPDLSELRVAIAGNDIPLAATHDVASCAETTPEVALGQSHLLEVNLGARARELFDTGSAERETLQVSHFSTRGVFERQFSFVDPASKAAKIEVEWAAPEKRGPVKQYLVVRDERGGVSWVSVNLCVREGVGK